MEDGEFDPTADGDRCLFCERLLFPEQRPTGECGQCPETRGEA